MAQKRMFDKNVVESDKFLDLPNSSKALYFMAGMEADDKGFFQPRKLQRMCGFSDDDYKILIAKGFFITFESGVMVVTDWNKNNWLDSRRITETEYIDELNMLKLINQKYEIKTENDNAKPSLSEYSIDKNSIYNIYGQNDLKNENLTTPKKSNEQQIYIERFETFYNAYPRKAKKQDVKKWFLKHKPNEELFNTMLQSLELFKKDKDWLKDDGQFIPYPTSWLNQERWEEKIKTLENKQNVKKEEYIIIPPNVTQEQMNDAMKYMFLENPELKGNIKGQQEWINNHFGYIQN